MALACKFRGQSFSLPTCWEDLTLGQVRAVQGYNLLQAFEIFTNIPQALIQEGQPELFPNLIVPALSFLQDPPAMETIPVEPYIGGAKIVFNLPLLYRVPDVEQETYGQAIDALFAIEHDFTLDSRLRLLAIYLQPAITGNEYDTDLLEEAEAEINGFPYLQVIAVSQKLLQDITNVCQDLAQQLYKIPLTSEQKTAGFDKVQELGPIITVDALANGIKKDYDYFLKQPWAEINNILLVENRKAQYQYKLNKILESKANKAKPGKR